MKACYIDFQKQIWSQTSEVLETSEVFREIIFLSVYGNTSKFLLEFNPSAQE